MWRGAHWQFVKETLLKEPEFEPKTSFSEAWSRKRYQSKSSKSMVSACVACSRCSGSGTRAKTKASERAGKKTRGDWGLVLFPSLPSFFPALSLALHYLNAWNRLLLACTEYKITEYFYLNTIEIAENSKSQFFIC